MRFLIFIPGPCPDQSPAKHFESIGLGEIAKGLDVRQVSAGPTETGGLLFGWLSPTQNQFDYFEDRQKWVPSLPSGDMKPGAYWVGFWKDSPPTEADLRRADHRPGAEVVLGNDESWTVPTPNSPERFAKFLGNGKVEWVVDERYNWLATDLKKREQRGTIERDEKDKSKMTFLYDDDHDSDFIARVLQINYRITLEVINELRLLPQTSVRAMVAAMLGMTLLED